MGQNGHHILTDMLFHIQLFKPAFLPCHRVLATGSVYLWVWWLPGRENGVKSAAQEWQKGMIELRRITYNSISRFSYHIPNKFLANYSQTLKCGSLSQSDPGMRKGTLSYRTRLPGIERTRCGPHWMRKEKRTYLSGGRKGP
ncbi:unnamed protein product [Dovyalis caffra]|uniref:Methylated-DNA--[protein]-cysteine S-methyltransferase n=1 Tax=Dovyalis caffra TaxID=77055 RepID=A0AAV1R377_9ROSI|nr:unnamed protein product [Dovyalis caffra]